MTVRPRRPRYCGARRGAKTRKAVPEVLLGEDTGGRRLPGNTAEPAGGERPTVDIVGAGIGGLTLAGALSASGTPYVIHEQTRELAEVGAGVQLSPNAIRPLLRLGLGPALEEHAVRIDAMEVRGWNGRPIARTPLGADCERMFAAPYLTIHRAHLHDALLSLVDRDRLGLGQKLSAARELPGGTGVRLTFDDGSAREADVVVGADGIHSTVRETLRRDEPVYSGLGIYRGLVPVDALPAEARERLVRLWLGAGGHFVAYPVASGAYLSYAATVPLPSDAPPRESWSRPGDPDELRAVFGSWTGLVADIVAGGGDAVHLTTRANCGAAILDEAKPGDRILILGARDDTLTEFGRELLEKLP